MDKLLLIIKREYLTRVRRRSFILATLLTPLGIAVFFVVVGLIFQYESDDSQRIAIIDEANILEGVIKDEKNLYFKFEDASLEELRRDFDKLDYNSILVLPPVKDLYDKRYRVYYYSDNPPSLDIQSLVENRVARSLRNYKIESLELNRKELEALDTRIEVEPEPIKESGNDATAQTGAIAAMLGMIMGFIMYMVVFIYGMMIMRSVMEEKTSRIVEVMISSVRPFQLMLGKIIGVGAVGLTQVAVWAVLIPSVVFLANLIFGFNTESPNMAGGESINPEDAQEMVALAIQEMSNQNWWLILPLFVVFFLGGYFLYSSLFAAVGSAMGDDLGEGQSLTLPIIIPVILALYIMIAAVQAPNSSLAVWSSIFPFFSPIVMPARLAFDPPLWEIVLSVVVLIATSVFFVWLSGRIYRIGIFMYGKKVSLKEIGKWMFYKG